MLKKIGRWNDFPERLLPKLPARGTTVQFQFLLKKYDPIANKGLPVELYQRHHSIPWNSRFAYEENGEHKWAEIGMLTSVDKDGNPQLSQTTLQMLNWSPYGNAGILNITIGTSPLHDALYQYLMLASFVSDNTLKDDMRDNTEDVIFRHIDKEAEARKFNQAFETKRKAMGIAANLKEDQLEEMALILGLKGAKGPEVIKQVWAYAESDPELFLAKVNDESNQYKARIEQALQMEVVGFDPEKRSLYWNDSAKNEIMKVSDVSPENIQDEYAEFAQSEAGKKVDQVIATAIKKKKPAKV